MGMMTDITVPETGKKIYVFDDVFEHNWRRNAFKYILKSKFSLGWTDQEDPAHYQQYLHSEFSMEEVDELGILKNIRDERAHKLIENKKIHLAVTNLSHHSDVYFVHPHTNTTLLYYANPYWKEEWAGETLFYNESTTEVVYTSVYKPGRLIIFDGSIPHTIRAPSRSAPQYRFTFAMFLDMGVGLKPLEE
jgi:hypothetical protein